MIVIAIFKGYS